MTKYEIAQVGDECITYTVSDMYDLAFASLTTCAFEIGNHGDISVINPFTGKRLWVGAAFEPTTNFYEAMRRALAVAEQIHFLGDPNTNLSPTHETRLLAVAFHVLTISMKGEIRC